MTVDELKRKYNEEILPLYKRMGIYKTQPEVNFHGKIGEKPNEIGLMKDEEGGYSVYQNFSRDEYTHVVQYMVNSTKNEKDACEELYDILISPIKQLQ